MLTRYGLVIKRQQEDFHFYHRLRYSKNNIMNLNILRLALASAL